MRRGWVVTAWKLLLVGALVLVTSLAVLLMMRHPSGGKSHGVSSGPNEPPGSHRDELAGRASAPAQHDDTGGRCEVTVNVHDDAGAPLAGASCGLTVPAMLRQGRLDKEGVLLSASGAGNYEGLVSPGIWVLTATAPGYTGMRGEVLIPENLRQIQLPVTLSARASVDVSVRAPEGTTPGVARVAVSFDVDAVETTRPSDPADRSHRSPATVELPSDGVSIRRIDGLPSGVRITLTARAEGAGARTPLILGPGENRRMEITLIPDASVFGRMVSASPALAPIAVMYHIRGVLQQQEMIVEGRGDGTFIFRRVEPGTKGMFVYRSLGHTLQCVSAHFDLAPGEAKDLGDLAPANDSKAFEIRVLSEAVLPPDARARVFGMYWPEAHVPGDAAGVPFQFVLPIGEPMSLVGFPSGKIDASVGVIDAKGKDIREGGEAKVEIADTARGTLTDILLRRGKDVAQAAIETMAVSVRVGSPPPGILPSKMNARVAVTSQGQLLVASVIRIGEGVYRRDFRMPIVRGDCELFVLSNGYVSSTTIRPASSASVTLSEWRPAPQLQLQFVDMEGRPVAHVSVHGHLVDGGDPDQQIWLSDRSDAEGRVTLELIPGGKHRLTFIAPGHNPIQDDLVVDAGSAGSSSLQSLVHVIK